MYDICTKLAIYPPNKSTDKNNYTFRQVYLQCNLKFNNIIIDFDNASKKWKKNKIELNETVKSSATVIYEENDIH